MKTAQLDVNDLMARIRAEAERRAAAGISVAVSSGIDALPFPPPQSSPTQPIPHFSEMAETEDSRTAQKLGDLLQRALGHTEVSSRIPKIFRRFFRKQGGFNKAMLDALKLLTKSELRQHSQSRKVRTYLEAQGFWLRSVEEARAIERSWLCAIPPLINDLNRKIDRLEQATDDTVSDFDLLREVVSEAKADIRRIQNKVEECIKNKVEESEQAMKEFGEVLTHLRSRIGDAETAQGRQTAELNENREAQRRLTEQLATQEIDVASALGRLNQQLADTRTMFDQSGAKGEALAGELGALKKSLEIVRGGAEGVEQRQIADGTFLKAQLSLQGRLIQTVAADNLQNAGRRKPTKGREQPIERLEPVANHENDAFYLAFEDRFRGTRNEIKKRMRVYLPFLKREGISQSEGAILDVGCGRGEWLQLLRESNYSKASGVDSNASMVEQCRGHGLDVTLTDGISHLETLRSGALAVLTAFHLIEHLSFSQLMKLLAESQRVLAPGGLAIFETPNARNILVGASDFYRDMTHRNPIHPDTITFALESVGFRDANTYFLADHGNRRTARPEQDYEFNDIDSYVNVPRDFAVIARRA
jgi:2-polyprenyl-3-methyl-5-hydroxy-6-metoxy-1,4-benzoquinol methylase